MIEQFVPNTIAAKHIAVRSFMILSICRVTALRTSDPTIPRLSLYRLERRPVEELSPLFAATKCMAAVYIYWDEKINHKAEEKGPFLIMAIICKSGIRPFLHPVGENKRGKQTGRL